MPARTARQQVSLCGFLANALRDLQGTDTLAYELIQNADDAPDTTELHFEVQSDMLVVKNNGSFREEDFDRLQRIASRGKRLEAETTGSFGIGFVAVYQVTDRPTVRSSGQRWTFIPEDDGAIRIEEDSVSATVLELPWARYASPLRSELSLPPITDEDIGRIEQELSDAVQRSALFLRKLDSIKLVLRDGTTKHIHIRRLPADGVEIDCDGVVQSYVLWRGDFDEAAAALRQRAPAIIEGKRQSTVLVALDSSLAGEGVYYSYLPTQLSTKLPVHIQADFFPSQNRKELAFGDSITGQWNCLAVSAAARILAAHLEDARDQLGHKPLWEALEKCAQLAKDEPPATLFWPELEPSARSARILLTLDGSWAAPAEAVLLPEPTRYANALSELGFRVVHPDLLPRANFLQSQFGIRYLRAAQVVDRLSRQSENAVVPGVIASDGARRELALLLESLTSTAPDERLGSLPVVRNALGTFGAPRVTYRASGELREVLMGLDLAGYLTADGEDQWNWLVESAEKALARLLHHVAPQRHPHTATDDSGSDQLIRWLSLNTSVVVNDPELRVLLRRLPVWPAAAGRRSLESAVLPGGFEDPLGIADLLDPERLRNAAPLLEALGVKELSLHEYVRTYLPRAFASAAAPSPEQRRLLLRLLASKLGELRAIPGASGSLSPLEFIETRAGGFTSAITSHLPEGLAERLLPADRIALIPDDQGAARSLFEWLGMSAVPSDEDLVSGVSHLVSGPVSPESVAVMASVIDHLATRLSGARVLPSGLATLKTLKWLPVEGRVDRWYCPDEVFTVFRRSLFASTGKFLAVDGDRQKDAARALELLGVRSTPIVYQVARHLRNCIERQEQVGQDVYQFLGDHPDDSAVRALTTERCIWDGKEYASPELVFLGEQPFGSYAVTVTVRDSRIRQFFAAVGISERPSGGHALTLLRKLKKEFGSKQLSPEARGACEQAWRLIAEDPDMQTLAADASAFASVLRRDGVLDSPRSILLEDRSRVIDRFGQALTPMCIPLPSPAVADALQEAGVRRVSEVVRTELVEPVDPAPSADIAERLRERHHLLLRCLAGVACRTSPEAWLEGLCVRETDRLVVRLVTDAFGSDRATEPFETSALLREGSELLIVPNEPNLWKAVAYALADELVSPGDVPLVAPRLAAALEALDTRTAADGLDKLGVAPDAVIDPQALESRRIDFEELPPGGGVEPSGSQSSESEGWSGDHHSQAHERPASGQQGTREATDDVSHDDWREGLAVDDVEGGGTSSTGESGAAPDRRRGEGVSPSSGSERGRGAARRPTEDAHGRRPQPRGRLRSYCSPPDARESPADEQLDEIRRAVAEKGCDIVMRYEREAGRFPVRMAHHNIGFDIKSRDASSRELRFIEVKARRGRWDGQGVALSRAQHEFLASKTDYGWLYVVEEIDSDTPVIHPIRNPVGRITQYFFDDGWRDAAESAASPAVSNELPAVSDEETLP